MVAETAQRRRLVNTQTLCPVCAGTGRQITDEVEAADREGKPLILMNPEYREGIEVLLNIPSVDILHAGYAWRPFTASFAGSNSPGRRRNSQ